MKILLSLHVLLYIANQPAKVLLEGKSLFEVKGSDSTYHISIQFSLLLLPFIDIHLLVVDLLSYALHLQLDLLGLKE